DIDADNDLDLFWGDFFSNSLYQFDNKGDEVNPDMQLISNIYPVSFDSVNTSGFNMPRFVDINNNGKYDLFVSVLFDPTVPQSLMFYSNEGTAQAANHIKITENYLKTLDVRGNSHPSFADIDNDGDEDLFIGSLNNPIGTIHFLENIGSETNPAFQYLDSSYFNITGDLSVIPTLGDLDEDNDFDLLVGLFDGKIDYYRNDGNPESANFVLQGELTDNTGNVIDLGTTSSPFLFDIDDDGDLDLSVGAFNGKFKYFENTGNQAGYEFTLNDSFYGNLDVGDNSTPFLIDYDDDNITDMFSGNRLGKFFYFQNNGSNQNPLWQEVTDQFIDESFGYSTVPYFIDIDNDSDTDLFLGNVKGGLYLHENTTVTYVENEIIEPPFTFHVTAHPNPFNPNVSITIYLKTSSVLKVTIFNILGEKVKTMFDNYLNKGTRSFEWTGRTDSNQHLPSGSYIVLVQSETDLESLKITFLK
ncbi:MAG: FG-GAP-like repeat-containing protein, partial [Ignavibacteriaceae bacterium]